ncbi:MAG: hypothetical protein FWD52_05525 [Candidatus Bathyarchaeota archaeon]|nr:hypothetical protein [Candidatus Termiticorpusculum sp.]
MTKNILYRILIIVLVVSLSFNVAIAVLKITPKDNVVHSDVNFSDVKFSEADFPLEIDLDSTVFNVGDRVSGTVTITNKSGRTVYVASNGYMPCIHLRKPNDTSNHAHIDTYYGEYLKPGDTMSTIFNQAVNEVGTYTLEIHYEITINRHVQLYSELEDIIIEVK